MDPTCARWSPAQALSLKRVHSCRLSPTCKSRRALAPGRQGGSWGESRPSSILVSAHASLSYIPADGLTPRCRAPRRRPSDPIEQFEVVRPRRQLPAVQNTADEARGSAPTPRRNGISATGCRGRRRRAAGLSAPDASALPLLPDCAHPPRRARRQQQSDRPRGPRCRRHWSLKSMAVPTASPIAELAAPYRNSVCAAPESLDTNRSHRDDDPSRQVIRFAANDRSALRQRLPMHVHGSLLRRTTPCYRRHGGPRRDTGSGAVRGTRARARRDACKLPANDRAEAAARTWPRGGLARERQGSSDGPAGSLSLPAKASGHLGRRLDERRRCRVVPLKAK